MQHARDGCQGNTQIVFQNMKLRAELEEPAVGVITVAKRNVQDIFWGWGGRGEL